MSSFLYAGHGFSILYTVACAPREGGDACAYLKMIRMLVKSKVTA
jgi:hypothetical protein